MRNLKVSQTVRARRGRKQRQGDTNTSAGAPVCFGPLKLCQYLLTNGVAKNGTETVFG